MFWKNSAWSWDDAAGHDDDDGGYLLAADLRRTPDSNPDTDLNRISSTVTTNLNHITTTGPKDLTDLDPPNSNYVSTLFINRNQRQTTQDGDTTRRLTVSIVRGKDGFGFTICCDCPVRVQAVDPGGRAHQSGLRQGDSLLQLNGVPVETWKCVDLAHSIRSCSSQIVLVVWRGSPELRSCDASLCPPSDHQTTGRKLLPHPAHSKQSRRRGQGSGVRSSLGALSSLWKDRKEEQEQFSPQTTTLKGTHVTSSEGDNYIILSPVNPGGQLLQLVYPDQTETIGCLHQTHPRVQNLQDPQPRLSRRLFSGCTSTLPPSSASSSSAPPGNFGNYQNCTIIQSHLPCSAYGTYVSPTPKTLIFPVFVQPLDLCSPDRTLLLSEEMILHQAELLPKKVTVLIYSDLLLFTREVEAGRCNVLQSPVYLNTLQLREVSSAPLQIDILQSSIGRFRCLFSLEAFSIEQKVRVSLCLHDNIQLQLVTMETRHNHQVSDLPSDFGLLSLSQPDVLYRPSSPYSSSDPPLLRPSSPYSTSDPPLLRSSSPYSSFDPPPLRPSSPTSPICDPLRPHSPSPYSPFSSLSPYTSSSPHYRTFTCPLHLLPPPPSTSSSAQRSPKWKRGGGVDEEERRSARREEEERQQGEGESASETSEGGVRGRGHFNMKEEENDEKEEKGGGAEDLASYRPAVLRRSLSEGSLLHEPRPPRFLSDTMIHQLTRAETFDLHTGPTSRPPSLHILRKQLTRQGGSLHHMLLLFNGTKDTEFRNLQLRKKTKSLATDVRSRLLFLRRRKNSSSVHGNSLEKALRNNRPSTREVLRWAESLEALLNNQYGLAAFHHFLRSEFSEENLDFWLAVEKFKRTQPVTKMAARATKIYHEFVSTDAERQVNVDSCVRESTNQGLRLSVNPSSFQLAQDQVFDLMETDSYPRFLRSRLYAQLANQGAQVAMTSSSQSGADE